jgi:hypothetical protein
MLEENRVTGGVMFNDLVEIDDSYIFADTYVAEWEGKPRYLAAVIAYADRGWKVFPAPRGERKSHKSAAYSDGIKWGATKDPDQIRDDFDRWPEANIGIPTGKDNDIWVLDLDSKEGHGVDGIANFIALVEDNLIVSDRIQLTIDKPDDALRAIKAMTLSAATPSGGIHLYFKWPADKVITNSTSKVAPGIDVRGEGGMIIAPPSVKPPDGYYSWTSNVEPVEAPAWLIELVLEAGNRWQRQQ